MKRVILDGIWHKRLRIEEEVAEAAEEEEAVGIGGGHFTPAICKRMVATDYIVITWKKVNIGNLELTSARCMTHNQY